MLEPQDVHRSRLQVDDLTRDQAALIFAGLLLALVLTRLPLLGASSLWVDESFSIFYAAKGLQALWGPDWLVEPTPPLYYSLVWFWTSLFGSSEPVLRVLSIIPVLATAPFVYLTGALLSSRRAGLIATALFVVLPAQMEFSIEIRCYSLQGLFVAITLWGLARTLVGLEDGRIQTLRDMWRNGWPVLPGETLALYSHATSVFFVAAVNAGLLAYWLVSTRDRRALIGWTQMNAVVFVLAIPEFIAAAIVHLDNSRSIAWIPKITPYYLMLHGRELLAGGFSHGLFGANALAAVLGLLIAWAAYVQRHARIPLIIGFVIPVIGLVLLVGVSLIRPLMLPRTMLWTTISFSVLCGCSLAQMPMTPWRVAAMVAGLALLATFSMIEVGRKPELRPWASAIAEQVARSQPNDIYVASDPESNCLLTYYTGGRISPANQRRIAFGRQRHFKPYQGVTLPCNQGTPATANDILALVQSGTGVWISVWDAEQLLDAQSMLSSFPKLVTISDRIQRNGTIVALRLSLANFTPR